MAMLNVANYGAVATECNNWVMPFQCHCAGIRHFIGAALMGELGIMDACISTKVSHCNVLSSFVSNSSLADEEQQDHITHDEAMLTKGQYGC